MATLHIEHAITEYGIWRGVFDSFAPVRQQAGVVAERVARPVDDPKFIVIDLDFGTVDQATAFKQFLETQIWSSPDAAPGLAGTPRAVILQLEAPT